jgi:carbon monoxide dehydrogenase subunit G
VATDQSVLIRHAEVRVDRDADWVFRELHDLRALMGCVPGGHITRILDARRFEACVVAGVGPFKIAYAGTGHIKASNPGSRTASLTITGGGLGMPRSRVKMSMVVWSVAAGAELSMSFRITFEGKLMSRELVDFIAGDLLDRTVRRIKVRLESSPIPPSGSAA